MSFPETAGCVCRVAVDELAQWCSGRHAPDTVCHPSSFSSSTCLRTFRGLLILRAPTSERKVISVPVPPACPSWSHFQAARQSRRQGSGPEPGLARLGTVRSHSEAEGLPPTQGEAISCRITFAGLALCGATSTSRKSTTTSSTGSRRRRRSSTRPGTRVLVKAAARCGADLGQASRGLARPRNRPGRCGPEARTSRLRDFPGDREMS